MTEAAISDRSVGSTHGAHTTSPFMLVACRCWPGMAAFCGLSHPVERAETILVDHSLVQAERGNLGALRRGTPVGVHYPGLGHLHVDWLSGTLTEIK